MNEAAKLFIGEHDFAGFCRAEGKARVKSTVRTIYNLGATLKDGVCEIRIRGNGFLSGTVLLLQKKSFAQEDLSE